MQVKLVSMTEALIWAKEKQLNAEELIVYTARVSNPGNQMNTDTSDKLISYLIKNLHWSPFEMVDMTVEIVTSRAIAQQILRHRSFVFQEFSQRYAKVTDFEPIQLRYQAEKNRQSSTQELSSEDAIKFNTLIDNLFEVSQMVYFEMINHGVAKECARFVLPLTTQTTMYMKGSIRSWIHYLQSRTNPHTQKEHQEVAMEILKIFKTNFPNISTALEL
ncbi:MAG: FAD-dependent thymidylate synthase [Candidatus Kapaibacterium sp.]